MLARWGPAPAREGVNVPRSVTLSCFERLSSARPERLSLTATFALSFTRTVFVPVPITRFFASSSSETAPGSGNANGSVIVGRRDAARGESAFKPVRLALTRALQDLLATERDDLGRSHGRLGLEIGDVADGERALEGHRERLVPGPDGAEPAGRSREHLVGAGVDHLSVGGPLGGGMRRI